MGMKKRNKGRREGARPHARQIGEKQGGGRCGGLGAVGLVCVVCGGWEVGRGA